MSDLEAIGSAIAAYERVHPPLSKAAPYAVRRRIAAACRAYASGEPAQPRTTTFGNCDCPGTHRDDCPVYQKMVCELVSSAALSPSEPVETPDEADAARDRIWCRAILDEGPEAIQRITGRVLELRGTPVSGVSLVSPPSEDPRFTLGVPPKGE